MDLAVQLLLTRQAARIAELESWIALLVIEHGTANGTGFHYQLCGRHAQEIREQLPLNISPAVAIEYDARRDYHVIDVL